MNRAVADGSAGPRAKRVLLADTRCGVIRLLQTLAVWGALLSGGQTAACAAAAEVSLFPTAAEPGGFDAYWIGILVGGGLALLGLGWVGMIAVRFWRRRPESGRLRAHLAEMANRQRELEAEVEHQRWNAEVLQASEQRFRTQVQQLQETLRASEARFRSSFELPLVGMALTGPDKRWWKVNDCLCEMLGYQRTQLLQLSWLDLTHAEDRATDLAQFERVMNRRIEGYSLDKRFLRQDGSVLYASVSTRCVRGPNGGTVNYFVTMVQDITERRQAEAHIQHLAYYDALTGLPNRALLDDRLQQAILRAGGDNAPVAILLLDLDRFKLINDTLGHTVGDQLLQEVAARLRQCARQCDTVSRQGGDEFAVLLPDRNAGDDAARIAQRILDAVAEPYHLDGRELHVTCSVGISLYPRDGRSAEALLRNADVALYRAKDLGRNLYRFYLSGATHLSRERLNLETSLRHAVERQQLELYYQPQWNFHANAILSAEALIRWNHPDLGLLAPVRFIPIAEDSDLILPIGEWILRTAIGEVSQIHRSGFSQLRIAVNLSARQFRQTNLVQLTRGLLAETGFDPACLELELTESILMQHTEENMATLRALRTSGMRIAIDDFGTGYSSLGYLQKFPLDVLKIDRAFVTDLPASAAAVALVDAIVTLAHGLGLKVVAEGVETIEQVQFLRAHGCDEGQGYYFGQPLPLAEFQKLLAQDSDSRASGDAIRG